jgi:hypothetical protein
MERENVKAYNTLLSLLIAAVGAGGACAKVTDPGVGTGSGGGAVAGTGGGGGFTPGGSGGSRDGQGGLMLARDGGTGECGLESFDLIRKPAVVMLVLDRSASMVDNLMDEEPTGPNDPTKWSQLIPALTMTIPRIGGDLSWGMKTFPEGGTGNGTACLAPSVTTRIDLPVAPMNAAMLVQAINAVQPMGDGTPTGVAITVATDYLKTLPADSRKYILLATDGQPSCYGTLGALTEEDGEKAMSRSAAVNAVSAAAAAGIHTFVVGLVIKTNDTNTLNALATAGLEARNDPNPLAMKFYQASTQNELSRALEAITGVVSTCVFPLSKPPPVPDNIAVKVSGTKAPQDPSHANGWDYSNATLTEVEVFGSWCEMIRNSAANKVEIIFGCPDIVIP